LEEAIERLEKTLLARRARRKGSSLAVQRLRERLREVRRNMANDLISGRPPSASGIIALDETIEELRTW
jgi:hypothetical protein